MTESPFPGASRWRAHEHGFFAGLRNRILLSLAAFTGWVSLMLLFLAFWATGFSLLQDVVVVIVSILVLTCVLLGAWISYGMRFVDDWDV